MVAEPALMELIQTKAGLLLSGTWATDLSTLDQAFPTVLTDMKVIINPVTNYTGYGSRGKKKKACAHFL